MITPVVGAVRADSGRMGWRVRSRVGFEYRLAVIGTERSALRDTLGSSVSGVSGPGTVEHVAAGPAALFAGQGSRVGRRATIHSDGHTGHGDHLPIASVAARSDTALGTALGTASPFSVVGVVRAEGPGPLLRWVGSTPMALPVTVITCRSPQWQPASAQRWTQPCRPRWSAWSGRRS
jgi:hypothetical protein